MQPFRFAECMNICVERPKESREKEMKRKILLE
jgi:hypothetical protein